MSSNEAEDMRTELEVATRSAVVEGVLHRFLATYAHGTPLCTDWIEFEREPSIVEVPGEEVDEKQIEQPAPKFVALSLDLAKARRGRATVFKIMHWHARTLESDDPGVTTIEMSVCLQSAGGEGGNLVISELLVPLHMAAPGLSCLHECGGRCKGTPAQRAAATEAREAETLRTALVHLAQAPAGAGGGHVH